MVAPLLSSRRLAAWSVLVGLLLVGAAIDVSLTLTMAPALLMLALFAMGVHPGERLLRRLVQVHLARVQRATSSRSPHLALVVRPSGRELASAIAMRTPPVAAPAA